MSVPPSWQAMVLAAGLGVRMRPLTDHTPKPLLRVGQKTMLDTCLDRLAAEALPRVTINTHYKAEMIRAHLADEQRFFVDFSHEDVLRETGGGVKWARAQKLLNEDPLIVLNSDLPWHEHGTPALRRMMALWDATRMDVLLLVFPRAKARGFPDHGDFDLLTDGRLCRRDRPRPLSHVFIGAQIVNPALYDAVDQDVFSNNIIYDKAESAGRLFGLAHNGTCVHVSTPEDHALANALPPDAW